MSATTALRWLSRAALALAVIAGLATAASIWLYLLNRGAGVLSLHYLYGDALAGLIYPAVGAYLARQRPHSLVGWVFSATSILGVRQALRSVVGDRPPSAIEPPSFDGGGAGVTTTSDGLPGPAAATPADSLGTVGE